MDQNYYSTKIIKINSITVLAMDQTTRFDRFAPRTAWEMYIISVQRRRPHLIRLQRACINLNSLKSHPTKLIDLGASNRTNEKR